MPEKSSAFPVIATVVALIGLTLLINLGMWQLDRAEEKRLLIKEIDDRKTRQPISLYELDTKQDKAFYHVQIEGQLLQQYTLYLDNRIVNGRPGFEVLQPLQIDHRVVLVNRGWIPLPSDRSVLPQLPEQAANLSISGIVYVPTDFIVLKEDQLSAAGDWPKLIQALDMPKLTDLYDELNLSIEPWVLRQDPDEQNIFVQDWHYITMSPERHISYAVTWFGLAIALVIIYIAALFLKKEKAVG